MDDDQSTKQQGPQAVILDTGVDNPPSVPPQVAQPLIKKEQEVPVGATVQEPSVERPSQTPEAPLVRSEVGPTVPEGVDEFLKPTEPQISPEAQKVGVQLAGPSTPVSTGPSGVVELPTEKELRTTIGSSGFSDSRFWRAVLALKVKIGERLFGRGRLTEQPT